MENLYMGGALGDMAIEDDLLFKIEDHEKRICEHDTKLDKQGEKIHGLELKDIGFEGRFTHIDAQIGDLKTTLIRMENTSLQTTNILMSTLSQIAINTNSANFEIKKEENQGSNEIIKIKLNNKANITLKILAIIGGLISAVTIGYFALKGVTIPPVM